MTVTLPPHYCHIISRRAMLQDGEYPVNNLTLAPLLVASSRMDDLPWSDAFSRISRNLAATVVRLADHYRRLVRSRQQWVGFAGQSFFFNPYLAGVDMFFVHPGAAHGAVSRCLANGWAALGTCGIYSNGRDELFRKLGLLRPDSVKGSLVVVVADTVYGFLMNLPGFILNYYLSGCGLALSVILGLKGSVAASWTSSISGGLFDTFHALDSDDPVKKARVPILIRRAVIDRFELKFRKKLIWLCLASSIAATSAIYCFAPGGLLR